MERIEARAAARTRRLAARGRARLRRSGVPPVDQPLIVLKTNLTPEQVRESFATPETVPFWELPRISRWPNTPA